MAEHQFITWGKIVPKIGLRRSKRLQGTTPPHLVCPHCEFTTSNSSHLEFHIVEEHTRNFPYHCSVCSKGFLVPSHLQLHVVKEHPTIKTEEKKDIGSMREINDVHSVSLPSLEELQESGQQPETEFPDSSNEEHRLESSSEPYHCRWCYFSTESEQALRTHCREHSSRPRDGVRPHVCDTCGRKFRWTSSLEVHKLTHSDLRLYPCPTCEKHFKQSAWLTRHIRVHTGEQPYICKTCGRGFAQKGSMQSHEKICLRKAAWRFQEKL